MSDLDKEDGSRLFTYLPTYMAPDFQANHYKIYRAIYSLPREFHSIKHFPNSFLNQAVVRRDMEALQAFCFSC